MSTIPHILIVDDDIRLRELLMQYLEDQGWLVTESKSAADAREKLKFFTFDVMILDVMMPNETGLEFAKSLQNSSDDKNIPPILMLTAMGDVSDKIAGLEAGVADYLSKPFEPRELSLRVQNILKYAEQKQAIGEKINFDEFTYDVAKNNLYKSGELIHLTMSELALLKTLALNINQPVSREILTGESGGEIANERSVDVGITRLRKKIEKDSSRPIYVQTVRGKGYALRSGYGK